jgi:hypothetical protein
MLQPTNIPRGKVLAHPLERRNRRPIDTSALHASTARRSDWEIAVQLTEGNLVVLGFLTTEERAEFEAATQRLHEIYAIAYERTLPAPSGRHDDLTAPQPNEIIDENEILRRPREDSKSEHHADETENGNDVWPQAERGENAADGQGDRTGSEAHADELKETPAAPQGRRAKAPKDKPAESIAQDPMSAAFAAALAANATSE